MISKATRKDDMWKQARCLNFCLSFQFAWIESTGSFLFPIELCSVDIPGQSM